MVRLPICTAILFQDGNCQPIRTVYTGISYPNGPGNYTFQNKIGLFTKPLIPFSATCAWVHCFPSSNFLNSSRASAFPMTVNRSPISRWVLPWGIKISPARFITIMDPDRGNGTSITNLLSMSLFLMAISSTLYAPKLSARAWVVAGRSISLSMRLATIS